jgi:hypothetical protein
VTHWHSVEWKLQKSYNAFSPSLTLWNLKPELLSLANICTGNTT